MNTLDSIPNKCDLVTAFRNKNLRTSCTRPPVSKIFSNCTHSHNLKCKSFELNKVMQMGQQGIRTSIRNRTSFWQHSRFKFPQYINDFIFKMGRRYLSWRGCLRRKAQSAKPHAKHICNKYFRLSMSRLYSLAKKWQKRPHYTDAPLCTCCNRGACPVLESPLNFNSLGTSPPLAVPRHYIN